ncbi:unnamed protein product [Boreogadus saida]
MGVSHRAYNRGAGAGRGVVRHPSAVEVTVLVVIIYEADEFLVQTQKRLRSEIGELCLANGSRAAVATETAESPPGEPPEGPVEDVVS